MSGSIFNFISEQPSKGLVVGDTTPLTTGGSGLLTDVPQQIPTGDFIATKIDMVNDFAAKLNQIQVNLNLRSEQNGKQLPFDKADLGYEIVDNLDLSDNELANLEDHVKNQIISEKEASDSLIGVINPDVSVDLKPIKLDSLVFSNNPIILKTKSFAEPSIPPLALIKESKESDFQQALKPEILNQSELNGQQITVKAFASKFTDKEASSNIESAVLKNADLKKSQTFQAAEKTLPTGANLNQPQAAPIIPKELGQSKSLLRIPNDTELPASLASTARGLIDDIDLKNTLSDHSKEGKQMVKGEELVTPIKSTVDPLAGLINKTATVLATKVNQINNPTINLQSFELEPIVSLPSHLDPIRSDIRLNSVNSSTNVIPNSTIQKGLSIKNDFSPNLALRIQWVYQQALSSAEILMDPPELGPLSVKISNNRGETNILFQVTNPATKEVIEDNLAKLKELLADQGINLGDTQVEQQQHNEKNDGSSSQNPSMSSVEQEENIQEANVHTQQGILDTYI